MNYLETARKEAGLGNFKEDPSAQIVGCLHKNGFDDSDCFGDASPEWRRGADGGVGVLYTDRHEERKCFFGLITIRPRRKFLGVIWFRENDCPAFKESSRGARKDKWVFSFYGQNAHGTVDYIAKELESAYDVKVSLRLMEEDGRREPYLDDGF